MFDLRRREFRELFCGTAAAWPLAARAQRAERMRRIGVLMSQAADDPESMARLAAFLQGLQELGWTDSRNVRIDYRWGAGDLDRTRKYAADLIWERFAVGRRRGKISNSRHYKFAGSGPDTRTASILPECDAAHTLVPPPPLESAENDADLAPRGRHGSRLTRFALRDGPIIPLIHVPRGAA